MNKKIILLLFLAIIIAGTIVLCKPKTTKEEISSMKATVLEVNDDYVKLLDKNNVIYTFINNDDFVVGQIINVKYEGKLDKSKEKQEAKIVSYTKVEDETNIPNAWNDNGMFSQFYKLAYSKLKTMSLDEKIGQIFLVRVPDEDAITDLKKYQFGGYILYEKDFKDKTKQDVVKMIDEYNNNSKIPLLIATDEEGGKVSRLSSNTKIVTTAFKSPSQLYKEGGLDKIKEDTIYKTDLLEQLGINVNLAPVVDVATDPKSYIYERTLQEDTATTSNYAKTVINASLGSKVSYVLKHFPGYGDNADTHLSSSTDNRTHSDLFDNDIPPFKAGINAGAEAVLVSHNIVPALDSTNPASLSASTHNVLRSELGFTGIIITDDLQMKAVKDDNPVIKAILAGNDLLIVSDYKTAIEDVKKAINDNTLSEDIISKLAFRILSWKYYKGMLYSMEK